LNQTTVFDDYADHYGNTVERSLGLIRRDLKFFTQAKVWHLRGLARRLPRPLSASSALDVGCGAGVTDELLLPHVGSLFGIDVSSEMVEQAKHRNPRAQYQVYGGSILPFEDGSFDVAFAICVVHHVDPGRWDAFLAELWRVTRPGGMSVVIEHNPVNPLTRRSVDRCPFDEDTVLTGPRRLARGFRHAGAAEIGHRYILFAPFGGRRVRSLERVIGWIPAGAQYLVWAQRAAPG
jgi:ubiquinone/menaquinone biosynthesis C-methylase UbiE